MKTITSWRRFKNFRKLSWKEQSSKLLHQENNNQLLMVYLNAWANAFFWRLILLFERPLFLHSSLKQLVSRNLYHDKYLTNLVIYRNPKFSKWIYGWWLPSYLNFCNNYIACGNCVVKKRNISGNSITAES
jgi:hypothetical protein